jgi:HlyD family secretion protein
MPTRKTVALIVSVLVSLAAIVAFPARSYWQKRNLPKFREEPVARGDVSAVVNATGTVEPVLRISIGSFVSGPIIALNVTFNSVVQKDDIMALIDPRLYEAAVARDQAALQTRQAEVKRAKAQLQQAINDEKRAKSLHAENPDFISDSEMDQFRYNREALDAQVTIALAAVEQSKAGLENSKLNLEYTEIRSPVDGVVIDRKIDPGQTLASQFQTPELFVVAQDMRAKMYIHASVDEADIGLIRAAQDRRQPVQFTVDAYPDELFEGIIEEIRLSSTVTQNVVTYPVVVAAENPDLKLLPGMTATISFQIEKRPDVIQIPNAALRYYPDRALVREKDRGVLDGADAAAQNSADRQVSAAETSAVEKAEQSRARRRRHVWIADGRYVRPVEVEVGVSDHKYTELISGDLEPEQMLVTGVRTEN